MNVMNAGSPLVAAIMRGAYIAIGSGLLTGLMAAQQGLDDRGAIIVGGISALLALGFRGGIEGAYDMHRDNTGDVRGSDVTALPKP
jgi:hypothetical protein